MSKLRLLELGNVFQVFVDGKSLYSVKKYDSATNARVKAVLLSTIEAYNAKEATMQSDHLTVGERGRSRILWHCSDIIWDGSNESNVGKQLPTTVRVWAHVETSCKDLLSLAFCGEVMGLTIREVPEEQWPD